MPLVKWFLISSTKNIAYKLPYDWVETEPSAQSPFQKENFGCSSQK